MDANGLLSEFTPEQRKWVIARLMATSDAAAARVVGIHPTTVSRWPNKAELDAAVTELLADPIAQAIQMLYDALPEAARIKVEGLKSRKDEVRQTVASEIMDRAMGKPTQRTQTDLNATGHITLELVRRED